MRKRKRVVFLADCQSFYASCEKVANPRYRNKPLVVAGDPKRRSGIILAACPLAKGYGVTTAESLRESLKKCRNLVIQQPRMAHYIKTSLLITKIYESYTPLVEPFSIDEQHIDVTDSLNFYGCSPVELAEHIKMRVMKETGINIRIGIGENKVLSKLATDNFAKKNDSGIYELSKDDLSPLWSLEVNKMFGIGSRMMVHLHRCGIKTIGDLANTPLDKLKRKFKQVLGRQSDIHAEMLWNIANGVDESPVVPDAFEQQKGIGRQTTLPVDFDKLNDIMVVILELAALVCQRSRQKGYLGNVVHVGAQGADFDQPMGFSRQMKLEDPTNITKEVYSGAKKVFEKHWTGYPVRKLWVSLSNLQSDEVVQLTLFGEREKQMAVESTMDRIHEKYGSTSIFFASSLKKSSQNQMLSRKIGGHYK